MKPRAFLAAILALTATAAVGPARATNSLGGSEVVIAMIDTGIRSSHQEFNYQGPSSTTDQIVAWWDFSDQLGPEHLPAAGQLWDTRAPDPYDGHGHGTGTAAMAAGLNILPSKTKSYAPGAKLAIAKVGNDAGSITGDIGAAIRWAADTVHADVVSMSIGSLAEWPAVLSNDVLSAIKHARDAGALVVVANGNGYGNAGLLTGQPGWASNFAMSRYALTVGANGTNSLLVSNDPEVASTYTVTSAGKGADNDYVSESGTSFATPVVAGMAAKAMEIAIANGHPATPDYIETLLKYSAADGALPPTFEGYGVLNAATWPTTAAQAAAGTLPARPSPDPTALYMDNVAEQGRDLWSHKANVAFLPLSRDPGNAAGVIGTSALAVVEGERYTVTLAPGESTTLTMTYGFADDNDDIDIHLYSDGLLFDGQTEEIRSAKGATENESITYKSAIGGTFTLLVVGWSVAGAMPYTLTSTSTNGSTPEAAFAGQDTYVHTDGGLGL